jgi:hypothetical protein
VIESGIRGLFQSIHVDVRKLLDTILFKKAVKEFDALTKNELWDLRYVMDMPLSQEGAWLRVVKSRPEEKTFYMHLVHCPFGSFILRSGSLLHGGHLGSPGNMRFHALIAPITKKQVYDVQLTLRDHFFFTDSFRILQYICFCNFKVLGMASSTVVV